MAGSTASEPVREYDGTTGTPAATATSRAASLRPIASITSPDGPTSVMPASSSACANGARSDRKP